MDKCTPNFLLLQKIFQHTQCKQMSCWLVHPQQNNFYFVEVLVVMTTRVGNRDVGEVNNKLLKSYWKNKEEGMISAILHNMTKMQQKQQGTIIFQSISYDTTGVIKIRN